MRAQIIYTRAQNLFYSHTPSGSCACEGVDDHIKHKLKKTKSCTLRMAVCSTRRGRGKMTAPPESYFFAAIQPFRSRTPRSLARVDW